MSAIPKTSVMTYEGTALVETPCLKRIQALVLEQIAHSIEAYTKTRGNSYRLVRLTSVSDERHDGKYYTHYAALVREVGQLGDIPVSLSFGVEIGELPDDPCSGWCSR